MTVYRLAYVVPTKDRPNDMRTLLTSICQQTRLPDQIVVVDGSDPDIKPVVDAFPDLSITYVREFPPSLARQRNAGMACLQDDIDIAGYLDDDIELLPDATEKMMAFWETAPQDVGGAVFSIICEEGGSSRLARLFNLEEAVVGGMSNGGVERAIHPFDRNVETRWLNGGSTLWRRDVIREFDFDEWFIGHGYLEDVDYSFRVGMKWRLYAVADAKCYHHHHPITLDKQFAFGRQQVVNRIYFTQKMGCFSKWGTTRDLTAHILLNLTSTWHERSTAGLRRFAGNIAGLIAVVAGRKKSFGEIWK